MLFHKKKNLDNIHFYFTRDSVSMGDDCNAPHKEEMIFKGNDTLIDLLNAAANYVPSMYDYKWEVICDKEVLGTLESKSDGKYQVEAKQNNALISSLTGRDIFCRKKEKIENLTYFEIFEVLYDGEYFNANAFSEYGSAGNILEEEQTKITTQNKEFAIKHGFIHRELNHYDKILPLDQFEGMRIQKIPNDPHAAVIEIDVKKEKIVEELEKRAKKPHDFITDGVLAYGVNVGRFIFEEEGYVVYVISDLPHIGASDVFMVYQISKEDYNMLLSMSRVHRIPTPAVSLDIIEGCRKEFLCGESAYCKRYYCSLSDVDKLLAERIIPD